MISFFILAFSIEKNGFGENFYKLELNQRREIFFEKMNEMLDKSFKDILEERKFVQALLSQGEKNGFRIGNKKALARLIELKNKYRINNLFDINEYLIKIAPTPKSLAISQAILESGLASSRFAREGNNLFGEWTWTQKAIEPSKKTPGKKGGARIFSSIQDSIDSYVLNLNRHFAYENFRKKRLEFYEKKQIFTGLDAIDTLISYSEIKEEYFRRITTIIKLYNLIKYDIDYAKELANHKLNEEKF